MSLTCHWFLPTNGDSRHVVGGGHGTPVTTTGGDRRPSIGYTPCCGGCASGTGPLCCW